ncbi:MAG: Biotin carboxylase, N-terminal domain, partial [Pseudomonadota bacterium]
MSAEISKLPRRLLIANRGEIACRIIRTAKR